MSFRKSVTLATLVALEACSTSPQYLATPYAPSKKSSQNTGQIDFDLNLANFAGKMYGVELAQVVRPGEFSYVGTALDESQLLESRNRGTETLESKTLYKGDVIDSLHEVKLDTEGRNGIKAQIDISPVESLAGGMTLKPRNASYDIATTTIYTERMIDGEKRVVGEEVYSIIANDENGNNIGTILALTSNTDKLTNLKTGEITLVGPAFYLWHPISKEQYSNERREYMAGAEERAQTLRAAKAADEEAQKTLREIENLRREGKVIPSTTIKFPEQK
jgi:hypothetical protein